MNYDEGRKYLSAPRRIFREIEKRLKRIAVLDAAAIPRAIAYDKLNVQVSPEDRLSATIAEKVDLEREVEELLCKYEVASYQRAVMIEAVENKTERGILYDFYIQRMTAKAIGRQRGYSERWVFEMVRRGIHKIVEEKA